jgi:phospholipase C
MDELYDMSGYIFTLSSATVSWRSYKQTILTRSTTKAELTTLDTTIVEVDWLVSF